MKYRTGRNRIDFLKGDRGLVVSEERQIKTLVTNFYSKLLSTTADTLIGIDIQAMRDGPQLTHSQALGLIQTVSMEDVEQALKGIDDSKSPGLDGFNSFVFKKV